MNRMKEIIALMEEGKDITIATLRPDGWPQATTVSYASDGPVIYFGCAADSQKARNLARDGRVSATINLPYRDWSEIRGVSLAGNAERITGADAIGQAAALFLTKFPEVAQYVSGPDEIAMFRLTPKVISLLDYSKGFGHHDLVEAGELARAA